MFTPEQIASLATGLSEMLGKPVEATANAVKMALGELATMIPEEEMVAVEGASGQDVAVVEEMKALKSEAFKAFNVTDVKGFKSAVNSLIDALTHKPSGASLASAIAPLKAQKSQSDVAVYGASNTYAPVVQIGKAEKPSLIRMASDLKAGKSASYQTGPTGGYILKHEVASEIEPALRANVPLLNMGVRQVPMTGTETMDFIVSNEETDAYWVGEATQIPDSNPTWSLKKLVPKVVAVRVPVPNKVLDNADINYESTLRDMAQYAIAYKMMQVALFGTGAIAGSDVGPSPRGLINVSGVTNTAIGTGDGATPTIANISAMEQRLLEDNVAPTSNWHWLFAPRTRKTFADMADLNGQPLFRPDWSSMPKAPILGYTFEMSTVVPINVTTGVNSDTSYIFLGDWSKMIIGIGKQFEVMVNPYRLADQLQTEFIFYAYMDMVVIQPKAFEILSGVRA